MNYKNLEPTLYDKRIAGGLSTIFELIVDVFEEFENRTWSSKREHEFGFYKKNKITKSDIFFGIWFNSWEHFGIPLCIAVDYQGKAPVEKRQQIKAFVEKKNINGVLYKDYQDYSLILFEQEFFNFENDAFRLADVLEEVANFMGIK